MVNYFRPKAPGPSLSDHMVAQHEQMRAQLDKLEGVQQKAQVVRSEFDRLMKLGDLVDDDDVMESASHVVGQGVDPMSVAKLLADAPSGSQALQSWISGQDQQFRAKEAQVNQILGVVRHETGLAALRLLAAQHMGQLDEGFPGSPPEGNGLMTGEPSLAPPAGGVDNTSPAIAAPGNLSNALMEPPGRAAGGPVRAGQPYTVGEQGPEVIVPEQNGTVLPNAGGGRVAAPYNPQLDPLRAQLEQSIQNAGGIAAFMRSIGVPQAASPYPSGGGNPSDPEHMPRSPSPEFYRQLEEWKRTGKVPDDYVGFSY